MPKPSMTMPDHCDDYYREVGQELRRFLTDSIGNTFAVVAPAVGAMIRDWSPTDQDTGTAEVPYDELCRVRAAGHAPWTGWPYVYSWDAAVDAQGRYVSGEATRVEAVTHRCLVCGRSVTDPGTVERIARMWGDVSLGSMLGELGLCRCLADGHRRG